MNETTYRIFDFLGFKNANRTHMDLWGFKIQYFNVSTNNQNNSEKSNDSSLSNTSQNCTKYDINERLDENQTAKLGQTKNNEKQISHKSYDTPNNYKLDLKRQTGNPIELLLIVLCTVLCIAVALITKK